MGIRNTIRAFQLPNLRTMFTVVFLYTLGFSFFTQFFPYLLVQKFAFNQSQIGDLFGYVGLMIAITQGLITGVVAKRVSPETTLKISFFALAILLYGLVMVNTSAMLYVMLTILPIVNGLTWPTSSALVSNLAGKESQGEVLGINQSLQSLGQALPPVISGLIATISADLPLIAASVVTLAAWTVFMVFYRKTEQTKFHEV